MSLIGIDVGSSSIKVASYSEDGKLLALFRQDLTPQHPYPGAWLQDPEEVWNTTLIGMESILENEQLNLDPPRAIAISASGRENFLADAEGNPIGPCIMAGDLRGEEFEFIPEGTNLPEPFSLECGHKRERMDPVNRLLWWRKHHPKTFEKAKSFPGWFEFLALRFAGRNVADKSTAGRWMVYDLKSENWSLERVSEYDIDPEILPEVLPYGSVIGQIKSQVADYLGISQDVMIAVGSMDLACSAIGAGVSDLGTAGLVSGSFENLLIPTVNFPTPSMLLKGLSVTPHPGISGIAIYALSPTGTMVLNWARNLLGLSIQELNSKLDNIGSDPSPILAVPYLSGAFLNWKDSRKLRGALFGLTLATSHIDITQAFMESIAYDHVITLSLLKYEGVFVERIRAAGGGSRSDWWTQLKADLMGIPIEIVDQVEPGTFGAALLAGLAIGSYDDIGEVSKKFSGTRKIYNPNLERADLHKERFESYQEAIPNLHSVISESG